MKQPTVLVIDAQGGGLGRQLIAETGKARLKNQRPPVLRQIYSASSAARTASLLGVL